MREEVRTETRTITDTHKVYIAFDGVEFASEIYCMKYENRKISDKVYAQFETIPHRSFDAIEDIAGSSCDEVGYVLRIRDSYDLEVINEFVGHFDPFDQNEQVNENMIGECVLITFREDEEEAYYYGSVEEYLEMQRATFNRYIREIK